MGLYFSSPRLVQWGWVCVEEEAAEEENVRLETKESGVPCRGGSRNGFVRARAGGREGCVEPDRRTPTPPEKDSWVAGGCAICVIGLGVAGPVGENGESEGDAFTT